MHTNSRLLFEKYAKDYFRPGIKVLEIGPDAFPSTHQLVVNDSSIVWHALDIRDDPRLTYRLSSEYKFPVESETYDIVLSSQVLEHVPRIWTWMKELARVCKTGGLVITINPVSWPYHEAPVDCWRVFPEGMKALYEEASLKVVMSRWQSLEIPSDNCHRAKYRLTKDGHRRYIPGRSAEKQNSLLRCAYRILGPFGFPVECAYDTITIGERT